MTQQTFGMKIDPQTPGVSFAALVGVEGRKLIDTRAAVSILGAVVVLGLLGGLVTLSGSGSSYGDTVYIVVAAVGWLLPIVGILLITTEWGQRAVVGTFTLEPRRGRVLAAKAVAVFVLGVVAFLAILVFAAVLTAIKGTSFHDAAGNVGGSLLQLMFLLAMGYAFAVLMLNTPGAVVAFLIIPLFAVPLFVTILGWRSVAEWFDVRTVLDMFAVGHTDVSGSVWLHLLVAALVWIGLPLAGGVFRVMNSEVK
ncbi:MAG: hypothetical protein QM658_15300 [Gordonia sp. (in: high G+C Gram-positive bacteria)]